MKISKFWFFFNVLFWLVISDFITGASSALFAYLYCDFDSVVEGKVIKSEIYRTSRSLAYDVEYEYFADGRYCRSDLVSFSPRTRDYAEVLKRYPVGEKVIVNYDKVKSCCSVIEKENVSSFIFLNVFYVIIMSLIFSLKFKG